MADTTVINWKSFCKPAILPLTTDYIPTANELNSANLYMQYPHTLSLIPDENDFGNEPAHLLQELLSQRLAQDFQIVVWRCRWSVEREGGETRWLFLCAPFEVLSNISHSFC